MFRGPLPDITPAQALAIVTWIAAQAVAYGWLSTLPSQLVLSGGATVLAAAWKIADAQLRGSRNTARAAAQIAGEIHSAGTPPAS